MVEKKKDFNSKGQPRSWEGMRQELNRLRAENSELESKVRLLGASIQGLNRAITEKDGTIRKQAELITELQCDKTDYARVIDEKNEVIEHLKNRGLWARVLNKD